MAIVKMHKVTIIGMEQEKSKIIEDLMNIGILDISDISDKTQDEEWNGLVEKDKNEEEIFKITADIERIKVALEYLKEYDKRKKPLFSSKRNIDSLNLDNVINNAEQLWMSVEEINKMDEEFTRLKLEKNKIESFIASLTPWKSLSLPVELTNTKTSTIVTGVVPSSSDVSDLFEMLNKEIPESFVQIVNEDNEQIYLVAICHKSKQDEMLNLLKNNNFDKTDFSEMTGSIEQNIKENEAAILKINSEMQLLKDKMTSFVNNRENIEILYDYLNIKKDRKEALGRLLKTGRTFVLEGFVPDPDIAAFKKYVLKWQKDCYIDITVPKEDEDFPILLENNRVVRPFELITELYSLPNPKEIDPNPYMAPFFFVFFGMMVSDAGYGLLISIATAIAILKFKPKGTVDKLLKLLFLGGISTFMWGVLFGGWFGDIVEQITTGKVVIKPLWFNPIEDPMKLLLWSFIFGVIQLYTAMGVKALDSIKKGKIWDAVFDAGFWYIFLTGLGLLLVGGKAGIIGKYMAASGAVLLILTQGRAEKNIFKKLMKGITSLYNAVGFMSDVLSYSRLLALGLATGVIASVINTIGILFGFNVIGIIVFIVTFIGGHIFNIMINALGAFVHASRLQYVEFYGKFFEGGGKPYKPFKINTKYININNVEEGRKN